MVGEIAACGANVMLANAGGVVAWYPTALPYQRINPYLRSDFLAEVTDAAHKRGIRVLARLDITKGYAEDLEGHPDWFRVAADGRPVLVRELAETCFSGPYWQRFNFEILDEIFSRYAVDGVFYNHFRYLTCYCSRCRAQFHKVTGFDMPPNERWEDPACRALVRYRYRALAEYAGRVKAHVHELRPGALVTWDYELATDNPPYARDSGWGPALTAQADVIVSIAFDRLTRPLPKWIYQQGEQASLGRNSFCRPTCVVVTHTAIFGNRRTAQPAAQLVRDIVQIVAHGGAPGIQIMGTFAQDDRKALPALRSVYRFLSQHAELYQDLESAAQVAVVYSQRTADWYARADAFQRYVSHYRGCYEALVHEHIPFDVVEAEHLRGLLARYRVVILPNVACLDDETAYALDHFVACGGQVIVTHETSLYDREGEFRGEFALRALGRRFLKRRLMQGAYLLLRDRAMFGEGLAHTDLIGLGLEQPYGGFGPFLPSVDVDRPGGEGEFVFTERAEGPGLAGSGGEGSQQIVDLLLSNPVTNNVPEFSYWEGETGTPGLVINRFGHGEAAYLPWGVGRLYHLYGVLECRRLIGWLVERALGGRPLWTDAPMSVEAVLGRSGSRTIVHLINATGLESKPLLEAIPVGPVTLWVRGAAVSARGLVSGGALEAVRDGDGVRITLPRLGPFEVLVVE